MMDLNRVQIFAQVVEQGSFTGAAKALGITKATVSRKIAELEAGSSYYNRINKILIDLQSAEHQLSAQQQLIKGNLKIVCPIELGQLFLGPIFAQFLTLYPDITIDAELTNRKVDAIEEGIDLLFQIADSSDTRLQSYALVNAHKSLMASPAYLAQHGTPKVPQDLTKHKAIRLQSAHIEGAWKLFDGKSWIIAEPMTQLTVNNVTLAREAAIAGLGITAVPSIIAQTALEKGHLIPLLDDYPMSQTKVVLSYPQRAYLPRKYRVFIEFIYSALFKRWGSQVLEVPDFISQADTSA
ncbi:LysR substrate-binding domain-containing protein [Shewanella glacialipiscicola]|uniref:substrate binding domain-containing protein n=1 Tax=Shewanella glacialipiscicola TaxID=614069 RepID=UPI003D7B7361